MSSFRLRNPDAYHLTRVAPILVLFAALWAQGAQAQGIRLSDVTYMDQPTGIEPAAYTATWPSLTTYLTGLKASRATVEMQLRTRTASPGVSDGELNLLAQLEWQRGELDAADRDVGRAVALRPKQSLNWFQQAMVDFAHLRRASGIIEPWLWQRRTRDAYQKTFDLDPRNVSARYYLAYSYMNTPWYGGGDMDKALALSEGGIALHQIGFYAVRADAHRLRGEIDAANADYDAAIRLKVIKLGGLLDAGEEELARKRFARAQRYFEWAVHCRPDSAKAYEGLGDYFNAVNDRAHARQSYTTAVQKDSNDESASLKLAQVSGKR